MSDYRLTPDQLEAITGASYVKEAPEFSVVRKLPDPEYRRSGGLSGSFLRGLGPTDAHALSFFDRKMNWDMQCGIWIHQGILTPDVPLPEFAIQPTEIDGKKWQWNRKDCAAWTEEQEKAGRHVLTFAESAQLFGAMAALDNNEEAKGILTNCETEISLFQRMRVGEVEFMRKARIDAVPNGQKCLVDIKSVQRCEGEERKVANEIRYGFWGQQAAWYLDMWNGCNPEDQKSQFVWIVVEKFHPFSVFIYYLNIDQLAPYRALIMDRMERAAKCIGDCGLFRGDQGIKQIIL